MAEEHPRLRDVAARVDTLEARLEVLESLQSSAPPSPVGTASTGNADSATFWALAGLKARVGDHSAVLYTGVVHLPDAPAYEWQQGVDVDTLMGTDWDDNAGVLAALGHPIRLKMLREVLNGKHGTNELGEVEGLGTSGQLYHHLRQLISAGWLRSSTRGHYEVPPVRVIPLLVMLSAARP